MPILKVRNMTKFAAFDTNTNQKQLLFLGRKISDVSTVFITPLYHAYVALYKRLNCQKDETNGFFHNACYECNGNKGVLICTPQGPSSQDVIYLFPKARYIFFGYAGGISDSLRIGDTVAVKEVCLSTQGSYTLDVPKGLINVKSALSPCFLGKMAKIHQAEAQRLKADTVDMELFYCAQACEETESRLTALFVITDLPNRIEVWQCGEKELESVHMGFEKAIEAIVNEMCNPYNE